MHFPRYWAKASVPSTDVDGRPFNLEIWGWSDRSVDDARRVGEERARRAKITADASRHRSAYGYPDRPIREPVLHTLADGSTGVQAVITRNSYGCDVLNTDRVVFVDVDLPPPQPVATGLFAWLATLLSPVKPKVEDPRIRAEAEKIALLERWQRTHPTFAFRVYRTAAGLRYLLASTPLGSDHPLVDELMTATGADRDYRRLCRVQKSFRARLTPKHWRCGAERPPHRFPFDNERQAAVMQQWQAAYQRATAPFATCLHLMDLGSAPFAPAVAPIVAEHDRLTRADAALPLA